MPVLAITKVDKNFRTTNPKEVRRILEISINDEIEWVFEDGKVVIRKRGDSNG